MQDRDSVVKQFKTFAGNQPTQFRHGKYYGKSDPSGPAGEGVFEFANGDVYCGNFLRSAINGQGNSQSA